MLRRHSKVHTVRESWTHMATVLTFGPDVVLNEQVRLVQFVLSCLEIVYGKNSQSALVYHKLRSTSAIENHESNLDGFYYPSPCFYSGKIFLFQKLALESIQLLSFARNPSTYEYASL